MNVPAPYVAKPRLHRNDGGWCCCNRGWLERVELYVGVSAQWGSTPAEAYERWAKEYEQRFARLRAADGNRLQRFART